MEITGLKWLGTRTDRFPQTVSFFRDVMNLEIKETQESLTGFELPNGDIVEVFGVDEPDHKFFTTGPVIGFGVTDIEDARRELEGAGIEFIGGIHGKSGDRWSHFYGPDGNVYEITEA
jgi:catechol 2,3-dioxygenase-like lactoylglutathione lyase family enzyme